GATTVTVSGDTALTRNAWTHLAATYDGSSLRLYVNGVQVASVSRSNSLATSTSPLEIGGGALFGQYFAGRIDEVRIYDVALTAAQVQADMNAAVGGVSGTSDLTLTKTHTGSFTQGQTGAIFTLTARNAGTAASNGTVTVTDTLPAGLTATAMSRTVWTCRLATLTCTRSD